ncbi:MAG TPA: hypothetical protein VND65_08910 [Candidatus Binatia bacterium]|nr:hypothetical protein [Candidatus Binatia bacterium]
MKPSGAAGEKSSLWRLYLARLTMAAAGVLFTLLAIEATTRFVRPQDLHYWDSRPFRRFESAPPHFIENVPGSHTTFIGVPVAINSLGLRGDEISVAPPANTTRVLVVGDSVTFGYGIPYEDTYPKVLERRLNEVAAGGERYEVLNGGTLGGSLGDYLHFIREKGELLQPRIVVVGISLNDILVYEKSGGISEQGAEWHGERQPVPRRISQFLLRHSELYLLCYSGLKSSLYGLGVLDMNKVQGSNYVSLAPPSPYQEQAWISSLAMLSQIVKLCRERKYGLLLVVFPMQMQMAEADLQFYREKYHLRLGDNVLSAEPQRRLREYAASAGVMLVDPLAAFRAHNSRDMYLHTPMIPSDPTHPSIGGNRVIADEIFRALQPLK